MSESKYALMSSKAKGKADPGGFEEVSWRMRLFLEKHMVMGHVIVM